MSIFSIGDFVVDSGGYLGKVAYIGPICLSKPSITWLGICWEDPTRGKNNGSLTDENGTHVYFSCEEHQGSFLQPIRVKRCVSLSSVFLEKYKKEGKDNYQSVERIKLVDDSASKKMIELVGMDQIAEYQSQSKLEDIELCDNCIISLGESLPLFSYAKRLNLSNNQIRQFSTVSVILQHFSSLQILLLNHNPIKPSPLLEFSSNLTTLALSSTTLHFNDVIPLLSHLPSLQHLIMSNNALGSDPIMPFTHPSLQTIDISSNAIPSWECIKELNSLETLRSLYLNENPLGASQPTCHFESVFSLHIASVQVESLQQLLIITSAFPILQEVEIRGNPWYDHTEDAREIVIAEIPTLAKLNYSTISATERKDAELAYLSKLFSGFLSSNQLSIDQWMNRPINEKNEFLRSHPTLERLLQKYGIPKNIITAATKQKTIQSAIAEVTIRVDQTDRLMKVPLTLNVKQFYVIVCRLVKKRPQYVIITLHSKDGDVVLKDGLKNLSEYGVVNGSVCTVSDSQSIVLLD